ncbi:MAG TPA: peptidoglycan-associated lipoprotein Pal [Vicinamibacterales bacterium]|nr:peptidoglycan-associated lipoprotein Pal [Vicinamibacterales bacterium]
MDIRRASAALILCILVATAAACGKKQPPVARPVAPPPGTEGTTAGSPPAPPEPIVEPTAVPPEPTITDDPLKTSDIDAINKNSPFQPVFFAFDSSEIDAAGQQALNSNVAILKKYPDWVITIEGHADERGTAEYNLALGERRAMAARTYLVSLGVPGDRLKTVSYGKEFPFDPAHNEAAWAKNRRAHFVVTSR